MRSMLAMVAYMSPRRSETFLPGWPASYWQSLVGSYSLMKPYMAAWLAPVPDSLPSDQEKMETWFLKVCTMRTARSR